MQKIFFINVPYYSQRLDVKRVFWRPRACGIVALKMAMDYHGRGAAGYKKKSADVLIDEGVKMGAYYDRFGGWIRDPEVIRILKAQGLGWIHQGLVRLARQQGFKKTFRKEWKYKDTHPETRLRSIRYIVRLLESSAPVLASVRMGSSGHLILLVGIVYSTHQRADKKFIQGFLYHDPDARKRKAGRQIFMPLDTFLKDWKGRIVVVKK